MKKIAAFFCSLFLGLVYLTSPFYAFAFSSSVYPAPSSPADLSTVADIVNYLLGGGELNVNDFDSSEEFLTVYQSSKPYYGNNISLIERSNYGHISALPGYINNGFTSVYNNFALYNTSSNSGAANQLLKLKINKKIWNDWTNYNKFWYKNYANSFILDSSGDNPNPDPVFEYITKINDMYISNNVNAGVERSSDFFSTEKWCAQQGNGGTVVAQNMRSYSYISSNCTSGHYQLTESGTFSPYDYEVTTPITINVYTDSNISDEVNVIYSAYEKVSIRNIFPTYNSGVTMPINSTYPYSGNSTKQNISFRYNGVQTYVGALISVGPGGNHNYDYRQTTFSTLNDALNYIFMHYCNINLYVDDILWVKIPYSSDSDNLIIPEFPDVIGGEELPSTTYEVILPDQDMNIDYNKVIEVIDNVITEGNALTLDDLIDGDVFEDTQGNTLDRTAFKTQTIDEAFNTDSAAAIGEIPDLPYDNQGVSDAFSGVSILAEIVDATQLSLPAPLVIVFWGIVLVLLIIGLIGLLHR